MASGGSYDPRAVEREIYRQWEEGGHFRAEVDSQRRPYTIVIPPPNVTGALHLGHALNNTLQDVLIRVARMRGRATLWLPGTDHAGIATQAVVEKRIRDEQNLTRHEIGRDALVQRIWDWKEEYNSRIINQLRMMGCSCDWSRTRFTLDETCARAVYATFFRFFQDGLIYRGLRLVNWDAQLQTAVADDEIFHDTVKSHLWHYRYPIEGQDATGEGAELGRDYLSIATTRPETMLGDTAVAVHPDDERYRHLIGKHCVLPLMKRKIPIVADGLLVKKEFGTGCVKVTPGHDPNDYACAQRNGLEMINILTPDGRINDHGGAYAGMDRYEARKKVVADLEALGLMEKIEDYEHEVGHSDRSKTPIEPLLSEQWFVKMDALAEMAMEAVRDGRVQFFPERYAKSYLDWLGEKRDWCISRQLWWGHRIPVWSRACGSAADAAELMEAARAGLAGHGDGGAVRRVQGEDGSLTVYVCLRDPSDEGAAAVLEAHGLVRDADVLDTWFSSALWPHSTLGWPGNQPTRRHAGTEARREGAETDLDYFYPTDVLCTARDIISLWVARMVMTGLYNVGRVPFPHVYIHAVIQDAHGRRMSKTAGNGVDPLDLIEMYGADAMRFTLAQLAGETQDIRIPVKAVKTEDGRSINTSERFELGRNFCNKLWQAATGFVLQNLRDVGTEGRRHAGARPLAREALAIEDRWILSRLAGAIEEVERRLARYQFSEAVNTLYALFWSDFCDWYIELVKPRLFGRGADGNVVSRTDASADVARQVLAAVLDQILRLLHPVTPFVTEALWKLLGEQAPRRGVHAVREAEPVLIRAAWPRADALARDAQVEREMAALQDVIRALRDSLARINTSRSAAKQPAIGKLPQAVIRADESVAAGLQAQVAVLERLGRCEALVIGTDVAKPAESATQVLAGVEVYVPLAGLMDLAAERKRLERERAELRGHMDRLTHKLGNESFVAKAPPAVVEQERARLAELKEKVATLERNLGDLAE